MWHRCTSTSPELALAQHPALSLPVTQAKIVRIKHHGRTAVARTGSRSQPHHGGPMGRPDPGRSRRRRREGGAHRRRRRHPRLGAAVPQGPLRRRDARGRLLSLRQSRQALDHARARQARGPARRARARATFRHRAGEFQGRHARPFRARLRRAPGGEPEADLLLDHRLRPERAAPRRRRLRLYDPGHVRPHERHRRARREAGRRSGKGRRADRRHHVGHVRGDRGAGGAGTAQRDRPRRLHRYRHARRRRRVPRQPGDELSGLRQGAAPHRQCPSQHPAAGRLRHPRRPHGAGGRQRRPVRQMLRGARTAAMGERRALREECRAGAQPRGAAAADRRDSR